MPIPTKTAAEYAAEIKESILSRNSEYDTEIGPIPDLLINPLAAVLELQNERIRAVQQLLSLTNEGLFTDSDLDAFVFNELLVRLPGARSVTTLTFSRSTPPPTDLTIAANFPVSTLADEETGQVLTFYTLESATMLAVDAPAYFNFETQKYELEVQAQALSFSGVSVGPNRISRPLRPLVGFDAVTNKNATTGGRDVETNDELIDRYYISLQGTSPLPAAGITKILKTNYPQVIDSNVVYGTNPLNVRSAADAGAIDVYFIGSTPNLRVDTVIYTGPGAVIPLERQPVLSVSSVVGANTYIQDTDFTRYTDVSGYRGSVRAHDGIIFDPASTNLPIVGEILTITYTYDSLQTTLQNGFSTEDRIVPGRDILFKSGILIDIIISANIKLRSGFNVDTSLQLVTDAILGLINSLGLGDDVELSDIQQVVRRISAIDNFVITNLSPVGSTGIVDVLIDDNEYARIDEANITLTLI